MPLLRNTILFCIFIFTLSAFDGRTTARHEVDDLLMVCFYAASVCFTGEILWMVHSRCVAECSITGHGWGPSASIHGYAFALDTHKAHLRYPRPAQKPSTVIIRRMQCK